MDEKFYASNQVADEARHVEVFARFLRDRIGPENVLFVSGTDCYGSPIVENHRRLVADDGYTGSLLDFVTTNHEKQVDTLAAYDIGIDLFAASALGRAAELGQCAEKAHLRLDERAAAVSGGTGADSRAVDAPA